MPSSAQGALSGAHASLEVQAFFSQLVYITIIAQFFSLLRILDAVPVLRIVDVSRRPCTITNQGYDVVRTQGRLARRLSCGPRPLPSFQSTATVSPIKGPVSMHGSRLHLPMRRADTRRCQDELFYIIVFNPVFCYSIKLICMNIMRRTPATPQGTTLSLADKPANVSLPGQALRSRY
jgi:hypothetical protein